MSQKSKLVKSIARDGEVLKITFQNESMDPSFVNALRRLMIGECPSYSLAGDFTIHLNTSIFNDEYIMTRVKMIPLFVENLEDLSFFDQKPVFHLCAPDDPKNPLINNDDVDLMVTTHMFQVYDQTGNPLSDYKIQDLIPYNIPIMKLRKGQEFHLEIEPMSGIGHNHATFKTGMITYKFENSVSNGEKKVSAINPITKEKLETIADKQGYPQNERGNPRAIQMTVSSVGHYTPENCLRLALNTLEDKLLRLQVLVDNRIESNDENETRVEIIPSTDIENYIRIKIIDPDQTDVPLATHTMGSLLAAHLSYRMHSLVNGDLDRIREAMTSYQRPHPLDEIIYLNIKTPSDLYGRDYSGNAPERMLDETINDLLEYIGELKKTFK